jgi:hypothetical protein
MLCDLHWACGLYSVLIRQYGVCRRDVSLQLGASQRAVVCLCTVILSLVSTDSSKTWVCGRSFAGIAGSNPTGGMDVSLVSVVCC